MHKIIKYVKTIATWKRRIDTAKKVYLFASMPIGILIGFLIGWIAGRWHLDRNMW